MSYNSDKLFQSLIVSKSYIKQLLFQIGELESEKDELQYQIDQYKTLSKAQINEINYVNKMKSIKKSTQSLRAQINKLKAENKELIGKISQLKN